MTGEIWVFLLPFMAVCSCKLFFFKYSKMPFKDYIQDRNPNLIFKWLFLKSFRSSLSVIIWGKYCECLVLHTVHCTVYIVLFIHTVHYTVYIVLFIHTVHCTVYIVLFIHTLSTVLSILYFSYILSTVLSILYFLYILSTVYCIYCTFYTYCPLYTVYIVLFVHTVQRLLSILYCLLIF